ncbi:MAG: phosphonate ABC transporter ATP-binding protein [Armatimonadetes bacterium]|nr:phosphonate ABC transporter ATP-binding protein [Armatimonadota bacterium]
MAPAPQIELRHVAVRYPGGVDALRGVTLQVRRGEFVAVVGLSGAGKSTLLRTINRLVEPTSGEVWFDGENITRVPTTRLREIRAQMGMIFQTFNLVKRSTVLRNVLAGRVGHVPAWRVLLGMFTPHDRAVAATALRKLDIADKAHVRADQLSGGQQQRVGIARALVKNPSLILADEPTGNLDTQSSTEIIAILQRLNREEGITIIIVTHEADIAAHTGRIIAMRDGVVVSDQPVREPLRAAPAGAAA